MQDSMYAFLIILQEFVNIYILLGLKLLPAVVNVTGVIDPVPNERVISKKKKMDLTQTGAQLGYIRSSLDIQCLLKVR